MTMHYHDKDRDTLTAEDVYVGWLYHGENIPAAYALCNEADCLAYNCWLLLKAHGEGKDAGTHVPNNLHDGAEVKAFLRLCADLATAVFKIHKDPDRREACRQRVRQELPSAEERLAAIRNEVERRGS